VIATSDIDKDSILSYSSIHNGLTEERIDKFAHICPSDNEMRRTLIEKNVGYDFKKKKNPIARMKGRKLRKYWMADKVSKNLGDISKIEELPYADCWTYSFPCFVEGTLVLTKDGYKPIEQIMLDDYVLTHKNRYKKVTSLMTNQTNKLIKVNTMCSESIWCTEEHPFLIRKRYRRWDSEKNDNIRCFTAPEWAKAKNLTKDCYVGTAINQESKLPEWDGIAFEWSDGRKTRYSNRLSEKFNKNEFWYLMGRYIGDGWLRSQRGIVICANEQELGGLIEKIDLLGFNYSIAEERTIYKVHLSFTEIGKYCEQFGRGASNKRITSDLLNLPKDKLKAFLDGYLNADGHVDCKGYTKISSVSRELIYGVGQLIVKAYNRPFSIYFTQRPKTCIIEGRVVNQRDTYTIQFKLDTCKQDKAFYEDGYIWSPVNEINEYESDNLVYNLEVEEDNSYVVQNIIVHNCQSISASGRQEGIIQGETRSGLVYEVFRLLYKAKENNTLPKYLLMENVKALVSKKFIEDFNNFLQILDDIGFNSYWQVVNAKSCGIAQNRERVFVMSIRKDIDTKEFQFPLPFDTGVRLKDVLEDEVDEKYYLSQDKVEILLSRMPKDKLDSLLYDMSNARRDGGNRGGVDIQTIHLH
jgi:site-specific DNA-cytosine methylase